MGNKKAWGEGTPWKNQTAFMTFLRGCLRLAWKRHPTKLNKLKTDRYKIPNPNPNGRAKEVFGFCCEMCEQEFIMADCQVDHKVGAGKLTCLEDIQSFVERLLVVTEDDLRLVCKPCNSALAYADKHGISYEEAVLEKQVIAFTKLTASKQRAILSNHKVLEPDMSSAAKRRISYKKLLQEGIKHEL